MVRHADEKMRYKVSDPQNQVSEKILIRAFAVEEFCRRYSVGRTTAYAEIKAGRLRRRKVGKRSIIAQEDAEAWLHGLPIGTPPNIEN
jgi:excisionase family DNA binding protein